MIYKKEIQLTRLRLFLFCVGLLLILIFQHRLTAAAGDSSASPILVPPPLINLIPRDLGNDEIWYIGGTASAPNAEIEIYLQDNNGQTFNFKTKSNEKGEWFHTHPVFLREGFYKSWTQLRIGQEISPPSPEVSFEIFRTALRIGNARITFETLYLALAIGIFLILLIIIIFGLYHFGHYRHKNARLKKEIFEAELEVKKGFNSLRGDIKEELEFISRIKKSRDLSIEEHRREEKLLNDLSFIEKHILNEIGDVEAALT